MPIDRTYGGYRIFVGDLGSRVGKYELEREFEKYGPLIDVWVARNPPGFAFLVYRYEDDAEQAVKSLDGRSVCGRRVRVEHARPQPSRRGPPTRHYQRWDPGMRCYNCGERGHFARDCDRNRRRRSRSRSRSYSHRSYSRSKSRSHSRSRSKSHSRSHSRSRSLSHQKYPRSSNKSKSPRDEKESRSRSCSNKGSPPPEAPKKAESQSGSEKGYHSCSASRSPSPSKKENTTKSGDE